MNFDDDIELLEKNDWIVECESPFEIRSKDGYSFARGQAAYMILAKLREEQKRLKTIIILIIGDEEPKFFIANGDYSKYHKIVFDGFMNDIKKECISWLWNENNGELLHNFSTDICLIEDKEWDKVAIITQIL